jgi:hypothetical protein
MSTRRRFTPEESEPEIETYNVAPPNMPPAPAGAGAEIGGEAAASRRVAGLPPDLAEEPQHQPGEATPRAEPFLGYDGLALNDSLAWIQEADPGPDLLREIIDYEAEHRDREPIIEECRERLQRWEDAA